MLPLRDDEGRASTLDESAVARLRRPRTLHDLLADGWTVVDVIEQDEFTNDVVISVDAELYAVFDST